MQNAYPVNAEFALSRNLRRFFSMPRGEEGFYRVSRYARPDYSAVQKAIGQRIRWARELVEPNGAAFARLLGIHKTTLQHIEAGKKPPSIFNVLDIAHRLRVTCDYILRGSLRGIDGEMAARLAVLHPELLGPENPRNNQHTATVSGTSQRPTIQGDQSA